MQVTLNRFGDLQCRLVQSANTTPERMVVLCHGFGAPGHDLVDLAHALCYFAPELASTSVFVFPEAPLELDFAGFAGARAWWHLDLAAIEQAQRAGIARSLADEEPAELPITQERLSATISALLKEFHLTWSQTIVGGFSQGAMLATDLTIHSPNQPSALVVFSGNLLYASRSLPKIAAQKGLRVFMTHGRQDPILPYQGAKTLEDAFTEAGAEVEFHPFDGGHTIPESALRRLAEILSQ